MERGGLIEKAGMARGDSGLKQAVYQALTTQK
jgi:hypothetical protein